MSITFKKASKTQSRARIALYGPSGSGKTFTSLALATELAGKEGRVAVLDTERGSASKYADSFDFDCIDDLAEFGPLDYCKVIRAAEEAGYTVLVIDSLTHAWSGKGGALEQVDAAKSRNPNQFAAWRDVTPQHNELIDTILNARMHVICTMRSKTEYSQEKDERTGKTVVRKIGLAPVQRDGMEYEFDICGEMDDSNALTITKTRCPALARKRIQQPGAELAKEIRRWLTDGTAMRDEPREARIGLKRAEELSRELADCGLSVEALRTRVVAANMGHLCQGSLDQWAEVLGPKIADFISRRRNGGHANGTNGHTNGHQNGTNGHINGSPQTLGPIPQGSGTRDTDAAPPAAQEAAVEHSAAASETAKPEAAGSRSTSPATPAAQPPSRRSAWPTSQRMTPAAPGYWRAKLETAIKAYVEALTEDPAQLRTCKVASIADGLEAQVKVPEFDAKLKDGEAKVAEKIACDRYRLLVARVESNDLNLNWASAAIPF